MQTVWVVQGRVTVVEEGLESRSFADDESTEDVFISINANVRKNMQIHCNENKVKHNNEYTTHACLKMKKVSLVNNCSLDFSFS
jgi:hypothetical protein